MTKKHRRWYIKFPGAVYANGPVEFDNPVSAHEVRAWARGWLSGPIAKQTVKRLPPGTQVWPA